MSELPAGFQAGDLYCFPIGQPGAGSFGYIPGNPRIEVVDGNTKASLLSSPAAGVLSVQAVWTADPQQIEAAQREISNRYPEAGSADLRPAELSDTTATLTVTAAGGATQTFGPRQTSGPDSYRVVFSETLTNKEKLSAISALRGQSGVLQIAYEGTLELSETATVELTGDLAEEAKALTPKKPETKSSGGGWFGRKKEPDPPPPAPPDLAACAAAVDRAIGAGKLKIVRTDTPNISDAVRQKTESAVRAVVSKMLFDKLTQMGADAIYMSSFAIRQKSSQPERVSFRISRTGDLGNWFAQNPGASLISESAAAIPEPSR